MTASELQAKVADKVAEGDERDPKAIAAAVVAEAKAPKAKAEAKPKAKRTAKPKAEAKPTTSPKASKAKAPKAEAAPKAPRPTAIDRIKAAAEAGGWVAEATAPVVVVSHPNRGGGATTTWSAEYHRGDAVVVASAVRTAKGGVHLDFCRLVDATGTVVGQGALLAYEVEGALRSKPLKKNSGLAKPELRHSRKAAAEATTTSTSDAKAAE